MISISEIEAGENTPFWKEVKKILTEWLEDVHVESEDTDNETDYGTFKRLGGSAKAIRRLRALPEIMKEEYLLEFEEAKRERKGE
jgi:hypothetical protein